MKKAPPSPETVRAMKRFEEAERLFQERAYSQAVGIYQDYLGRFPKGPLVDTALMKTGAVYMAAEDYQQARQAFKRLVYECPKSPFAEDARFNVVLTYYNEADYRSALRYGKSFLKMATSRLQKSRIYNLIGYTCTADKRFKDAIKNYMDAYRLASDQDRMEIMRKVREVIIYLKESELNSLIGLYKKKAPGGYLRLRLAKKYASDDMLEPAMKVLSDFVSLFPHHDEFETALALMEELKSRALVKHSLIGCILPLSGPYRTFGTQALTGIEHALDRFNAQGHVNPIQLIIKDSKGDPNEAVRAIETLVLKDGVVGIIGPMITSESAAIRAQALKVPIMTLTQKPDITKLGDHVFRNFLTLSLQVKTIVEYATEDLGLRKFAIFYPHERYGVSFMNRFWDELIRYGAEVVGIESYEPDQTDFSNDIKKLVGLYYPRPKKSRKQQMLTSPETIARPSSDEQEPTDLFPEGQMRAAGGLELKQVLSSFYGTAPDQDEFPSSNRGESGPIIDFEAIFIPDSFEKVGLVAPQFLYHDVADVVLLGTNLWHSDKLIKTARRHVQGAIVPDGFFMDSPSPDVQDFVNSFKEVFGRTPAFLEAQAYDAAWILFQAANQPQVRSRQALKAALLEVKDFSGVTGLTSFDETGDAEKQLYLLKVEGDHFAQIKP